LLIIDETGRRTGFDPLGNQDAQDIPDSAYFRDSIDNDRTGELSDQTSHLVIIPLPTTGTYQIHVVGIKEGSYDLSIAAFSRDGSEQREVLLTGTTAPGQVDRYTITYSPEPGAQLIVQGGNRPPVAEAGPDRTVECTGAGGTTVTLTGTGSSDPDGDTLTYTWTGAFGAISGPTPTVNLPVGVHHFSLTVSDGKGGLASDQVVVTVRDTVAPVITTLTASPPELWPPNHRMVSVSLAPMVSDACDSRPTCRIVGVSSNEPVDGLGDGDTSPDWTITGPLTANLRAERSGKGTGRLYTVTVQCADAAGNQTTKSVTVSVPQSRGKK
jgi:hypothetical protein